MEAAACCLPPHGLRVPVASAHAAPRPGPGGRPLWRPWLPRAEEGTGQRREQMDTVYGEKGPALAATRGPHAPRSRNPRAGPTITVSPQAWPREAAEDGGPDKALAFFHHPVRLLWPKSKSFDYLYAVGEKLLQNFPVQATLCLYEDSGSEEDEEEGDEEEGDEEEEDEEEKEEEAGAMPEGPQPHAGSAARPA
ncbi:protein ripply1 [Neopsephotus bourkii]|uniref:protein ripply1 n=1 Tax=Neopsephotus bourkii TaxID=309878 RepID=UPI002AA51AC9|nr:protein ripply1 [Neopsephotus bourkii]